MLLLLFILLCFTPAGEISGPDHSQTGLLGDSAPAKAQGCMQLARAFGLCRFAAPPTRSAHRAMSAAAAPKVAPLGEPQCARQDRGWADVAVLDDGGGVQA